MTPLLRRLRATALAVLGATLAACGGDRISLSNVAPPSIRVLLGASGDGATIAIADAWEATSMAGRPFQSRGTNLQATVVAGPQGIVFGGTATGATAIRVRPVGAFTLELDGERRAYRGDLIVRLAGSRMHLVNEIDLERYVAGVIGHEMGFGEAPASLKAQAVTARTYGYFRVRGAPDAPHHLTDDTMSQVYKGVTVPAASPVTFADLERFTAETRGVVLTWKGEPFPTYYASTCGGHTTEAETSALDPAGASAVFMGQPCAYCRSSKYFAWTEVVPIQKLVDALKPRGIVAPITRIEWTKKGRGGWVSEVTLTYGRNDAKKVVPGQSFRFAAGLRSMRIDSLEARDDGTLLFRGGGWGHGVGMCQVGAQEMGRRGFAPDQILRYYYPGAEFTRLY